MWSCQGDDWRGGGTQLTSKRSASRPLAFALSSDYIGWSGYDHDTTLVHHWTAILDASADLEQPPNQLEEAEEHSKETTCYYEPTNPLVDGQPLVLRFWQSSPEPGGTP